MHTLSSILLVLISVPALQAQSTSVASLVSKALATHPEVRYYEAEITAAKGGQRTAATLANPELETSFGTWRVKDSSGGGRSDGPAWAVTLSQQIEWPGRIALRKAIASKQLEVAQLGLEQFKATLSGKVRTAAWTLMAAQERARAAEGAAKRLNELCEVLLQRDHAGPAPRLEARIIQASALTLGRQASKARRELANARFTLNQLLGDKPEHAVEIAREPFSLAAAPSLDVLLATARKHNFDLRSRMLDVEQQGFTVKLAENERWPAFKIAPYFQQQRAETRETQFGIGVSVPLPLFNNNKGAIDTAKAKQTQAEMMLAAQMRDLEREVAAARNEYSSYVEELGRSPVESLDAIQKAAVEADENYRLAALPLSTFIELQQQSVETLNGVLDSQLGAVQARMEIETLTGLSFNK